LLAVMPNTISPEKYPLLREKFREKFLDLFSLSSGPLNTSERVAELLCCLPTFEVPDGLSYENVFRVTIVQFLDRFNFCVGNVKRSCIHFVTPKGEIIPFDTYNLFYRDGSIDGIRARMAKDAAGTRQGVLQP
jgi:7,8-dihydro-6-hydroxymethylpterin dimethyltransferase